MDTDNPRLPQLLDGATATNLFLRGMPRNECTEEWMLSNRASLRELQTEYVKAGSDVLYAPTFSANRPRLARFGLQGRVEDMNRRLVQMTREVAEGRMVAGGMSPTMLSVEPFGDTSFDELTRIYAEQAAALDKAGVDLFVIETMLSLTEARAAILACRPFGKPIYVTMVLSEKGKIFSGASPLACLIAFQALGILAFGFNCSCNFEVLEDTLEELSGFAEVPLIAKPSAGKENPLLRDRYDVSPFSMRGVMERLLDAGASIIGGCCGTTPAHIGELRSLLDGYVRRKKEIPAEEKHDILLTSDQEVFQLDNERIAFSEHISCEFDMASALLTAGEEGADVLLVDVETPEEAYQFSQNAPLAKLPVCFHSDNEEALERALFLYNGRCMVDCESAIPPNVLEEIAARYGAVVY